MNKQTKANIFYIISLLCGLWFLLFGTTWGWWFALFVAYPPGLLGLLFWYLGKKNNPDNRLNKITLVLLIVALVVSVTTFILVVNDIWVPTIIRMPD